MKNYDILHNNHVQCGYELTHYFILLPSQWHPSPRANTGFEHINSSPHRNRKIEPNEIAEHYSNGRAYHHVYRVAPAQCYVL